MREIGRNKLELFFNRMKASKLPSAALRQLIDRLKFDHFAIPRAPHACSKCGDDSLAATIFAIYADSRIGFPILTC